MIFYRDKASQVMVEAIMDAFAVQWYENQGFKVSMIENFHDTVEGKRGYDRKASNGDLWEYKDARAAWYSKVYVPIDIKESKATHFLYMIQGRGFVFRREPFFQFLDKPWQEPKMRGNSIQAPCWEFPPEQFMQQGEEVLFKRSI